MKNINRRERERKELKYKILETGRLLFSQGGEDAVALRRVADVIEFSATTIYQFFPNKDSLIQEICAVEFARLARTLQQAEQITDAMDRLRKVMSVFINFGLQNPDHYRVLFMREPSPPDQKHGARIDSGVQLGTGSTALDPALPSAESPYASLHRAVFKALAAGCFKTEYRDAILLAQCLWSSLHGVIALHLVRAQQADVPWKPIQSIADLTVEALLNGLTAISSQTQPQWRV